MLAEEFVEAATSAKEAGEAERDSLMPEEIGGPFTLSRAQDELAQGHDASNPEGTLREPFPMPGRVQGVHALASWLTRS
jgi:hypothetical protein